MTSGGNSFNDFLSVASTDHISRTFRPFCRRLGSSACSNPPGYGSVFCYSGFNTVINLLDSRTR